MVVREDGTKWACHSCLKGHRVSGCTHTDRELVLVPKKGRPVTQCQHCRQERKKRSAHVKCDCGETDKPHHSREKCIHLREAEEKAKANHADDIHEEKDPAHLVAVAEEQGCCCHHGGKCSCALLRREDDDTTCPPHGQPAVQKPRLDSHKSEGSLTVFANGHHKPVHRKNFAAHESGMPYKLPMPRAHTDYAVSRSASRSTDNLRLNTFVSSDSISDSSVPYPIRSRRMSKSEQTSPKLMACHYGSSAAFPDTRPSAFDFAGSQQSEASDQTQSAVSHTTTFPSLDPMSSIADSSFDPWSAYPSADSHGIPNNNPFGVWPTTTDANGLAQPALTAASSGTQSEIDEVPGIEDWFEPGMPSIQEDAGAFDIDALLASNSQQSNRHSLPPSFFGNTDLSISNLNNQWQTQVSRYTGSNEKPKSTINMQLTAFDSSWQLPVSPPITDLPHRPHGMLPSRRQTSHSMGTSQTPASDILSSLFPEIDYSNEPFRVNSTQGLGDLTSKAPVYPPNVDSNTLDFNSFDTTDSDFTSQSWTDGSMSVPNDAFASFPFDQDFQEQDFSNSWTQQPR